MMDFGALPPEVNSARMYSGAGSGPMFASAIAWSTLASELESSAAETRALVGGLDAAWQGPSAEAMNAKMASHALWLTNQAAMAQHTATQANTAVAAYQAAYAATVNPALIAYNRSELSTLSATNILGQNTAAIMANEAEYSEMWATDAAAMYGYSAQSQAATTALQTPAAPADATTPVTIDSVLQQLLSQISLDPIGDTFNGAMVSAAFIAAFIQGVPAMLAVSGGGNGFNPATAVPKLSPGGNPVLIEPNPAVPVVPRSRGGTAGMGVANRLGRMSVPPSWASSTTTASSPTAGRFTPYGGGQPGSPMGVMPMGGAGKQSSEERRQQPRLGVHTLNVLPK